jgi:hypothetical protein
MEGVAVLGVVPFLEEWFDEDFGAVGNAIFELGHRSEGMPVGRPFVLDGLADQPVALLSQFGGLGLQHGVRVGGPRQGNEHGNRRDYPESSFHWSACLFEGFR